MDPSIEKVLKLPTRQKVALLVLVLLVEGVLLYQFLYRPRLTELKELQTKVEDLDRQIQESRRIANNLPKYKEEYEGLKKDLDAALTELPNSKEIPTLLTSISNAGKAAGLEFLLFRPRQEEKKDFYAAVPVDVSVSGSFSQVADFFVAVGKLPRIVNINNVNFADIKNVAGKTTVKVNCLATTFRFLDKKETKDEKTPAPK